MNNSPTRFKTIEESAVIALDGSDKELFPFLPYILQDIWEIGTDPETVISIIVKYFDDYPNLTVLDLGCGKGAVSINVAHRLKCHCYGIDAIEDFIQFANQKALEMKVDDLCNFKTGDIRQAISNLPPFDIIILGAIGPVFGDYFQTLSTLKSLLKNEGAFIIDDAYIQPDSDFRHPMILNYIELIKQIEKADMHLVESLPVSRNEVVESDNLIFDQLKVRCNELMIQHPEKKDLFLNYIKKQEFESDVNANKVICATIIISKTGDNFQAEGS